MGWSGSWEEVAEIAIREQERIGYRFMDRLRLKEKAAEAAKGKTVDLGIDAVERVLLDHRLEPREQFS